MSALKVIVRSLCFVRPIFTVMSGCRLVSCSNCPVNAIVLQVSDVYRKIRLTIRFLLGNVHDFDPSQDSVPHSELPLTDRYLLSRFANLLQDAKTSYSQYQFSRVYQVGCAQPCMSCATPLSYDL